SVGARGAQIQSELPAVVPARALLAAKGPQDYVRPVFRLHTSTGQTRVGESQNGIKDVTIIGGGPTGLFAAFYAGLRGVSCRIVDALPQLGGQLMALYPEKYIFDVGGLPRILAKDLVTNMIEQGTQFGPEVLLEA